MKEKKFFLILYYLHCPTEFYMFDKKSEVDDFLQASTEYFDDCDLIRYQIFNGKLIEEG